MPIEVKVCHVNIQTPDVVKATLCVHCRNLQSLVKCITLRRTKRSEVNGRPLVALPEKTVFVEQVELSQQEREEYELARNEGRNTIRRCVCVSATCKE